jgi:hypothetical protein
MIKKLIERSVTQKMVLVAVTPSDEKYVFDRAQFETWFGNRSARLLLVSPKRAGRSLIKQVTSKSRPKYAVQRSPALGATVYFVFWFPQTTDFNPDDWAGKVARLDDVTLVNERQRSVVLSALERARKALTAQNLEEINKAFPPT